MSTLQQKQSWEKWTRWGQLGNPSSHWTIGLSHQWYFVALFVLTLFHLFLSAYLPPAEDELYYWTWAKHLQWSYFDHPPMVAYWVRVTTAIFGDSILAIRLSATISTSIVLMILGFLVPTKQILGLLLLTPIYLLASIIVTPDVPLIFFWALYLLWMMGACKTLRDWSGDPITRVYRQMPVSVTRWIGGGLLLGFGGLSKYSMILAVPCAFITFATKYRAKGWLSGFAIQLVTAGLVCLPVFFFNWKTNFAPFEFQWTHSMGGTSGFSLGHFFTFLGSQVLLLGALPFLFLPGLLIKGGELCDEPRGQVCFHFFVFPMLFFLLRALRGPLEGNWALAAYISFWPLSQRFLDESSFRGILRVVVGIAFLIPLAASVAFIIHSIIPLSFITPEKDRLRKLSAQYELSVKAGDDIHTLVATLPVFTTDYQWTSYLRYQGVEADQLSPEGRPSNFTIEHTDPCPNPVVIAFLHSSARPGTLSCFPKREIIKEYPLVIRGSETSRYVLVRYKKE